MNYRNCIPSTRFKVGDLVLTADCDKKYSRLITKVLKNGYKYLHNDIEYSTIKDKDPYMIWWRTIH